MEAPKYSKSRIMKSAWSMFKAGKKYRNHVLTFGECLKEAWKNERSSYNKAMNMYNLWNLAAKQEKERDAMAFMADTLVNYYANNRYNGD